jgi:excisionase family DNA binding protein
MAGNWPDDHIAATLNRMGLRTGHDQSWTMRRVQSYRRTHKIPGARTADRDGEWLTMSEAACELGVTNHVIRRLIRESVLPAEQVVPGALYKILAADLQSPRVREAVERRAPPRRTPSESQSPLFPDT